MIQAATGETINQYFIAKVRNKIVMNGAFLKRGYNNVYFSTARSMARCGLQIQLPVNSHVSLKVFDVTGREVATLVEGEMAAGNHAMTFAPRDWAGGLYFYQLTAGKFIQTRKAVLMK